MINILRDSSEWQLEFIEAEFLRHLPEDIFKKQCSSFRSVLFFGQGYQADAPEIVRLKTLDIPVLFPFGSPADSDVTGFHALYNDMEAGTKMLLDHLKAQGCASVGILGWQNLQKGDVFRLPKEKYLELIEEGAKPSEILVLVQNSTLKKRFNDRILKNINANAIEKLQIHSFFSIVYNTLVENWCFIENSIPSEKAFILPNLVGLEVSQFLLKDILKRFEVKGYNSKKSLLHQIFRRYSLIVQNNLNNEEVKERSKILKESFGEDAEFIIKKMISLVRLFIQLILTTNFLYQPQKIVKLFYFKRNAFL